MNLKELAEKESQLYAGVIEINTGLTDYTTGLSLVKIFKEYRKIFTHYAKLCTDDIEALKRGIFMLWYSRVEPENLTGIYELNSDSEDLLIGELHQRIYRDQADEELLWMFNYYLNWDYVFSEFKDISKFQEDETIKLPEFFSEVGERGQMGIYWNSIIND